ncbi:hypothetical protein P7C71_g1532, partial [Lecanoromycetidae sp. Uapishka_2]
MAFREKSNGLAVLHASISSLRRLIQTFQLALQSSTAHDAEIESAPNPLALLSDAAKVLRAQTTKLSLLITQKPFSPSEITFILNALSSGCLPGLMSALELCDPNLFTQLLHNRIKSSLSMIFTELLNLLASIPQDEHGIEKVRRSVLASTGVLWAECDNMVELGKKGLVWLARQRVEELHDLLKDAIQELEEWDLDEDSSDSETNFEDRPTTSSSNDKLVETLGKLSVVPSHDLDLCRKRILVHFRTIRILFPALQKARIDKFSNITDTSIPDFLHSESHIDKMDRLVTYPMHWTDCADEIAGLLYDHNQSMVEMALENLRKHVANCVEKFQKDWNDEEDAFTGWGKMFLGRLHKVGET